MSNDEERRTPIQTYALTVCFTSLLIGGIFLGIAALDIVQMSVPEFTNPYSDQEGKEHKTVIDGTVSIAGTQFRHTNAQHVMYAKQSFLSCSITLILSGLFFLFHWRLAKRYERDSV
jgi:hypothetical protein